jgi:hypothetical protein
MSESSCRLQRPIRKRAVKSAIMTSYNDLRLQEEAITRTVDLTKKEENSLLAYLQIKYRLSERSSLNWPTPPRSLYSEASILR